MNNLSKIKESKTKWPLPLDFCFQKRVSPEWWGMLFAVAKFISLRQGLRL